MPTVVIVATVGAEDTQVTMLVTSVVLPSAKVSVAVNCCEVPSGMVGLCGLMASFTTLVEPGVVLLLPHPLRITSTSPSAAGKTHRHCRNTTPLPNATTVLKLTS